MECKTHLTEPITTTKEPIPTENCGFASQQGWTARNHVDIDRLPANNGESHCAMLKWLPLVFPLLKLDDDFEHLLIIISKPLWQLCWTTLNYFTNLSTLLIFVRKHATMVWVKIPAYMCLRVHILLLSPSCQAGVINSMWEGSLAGLHVSLHRAMCPAPEPCWERL